MLHYLLKSTNEFRFETVEEVEKFHKELQGQASAGQYQLTSFGYTEKVVSKSGEIVEDYFIVKVSFTFNSPKEPDLPIFSVEFPYDAAALIDTNTNDSEEAF